ncbi:ROK family glucokinase [Bacillus testis]|uniref:ROK family glucokinase n=1 Tax=Bacillus testis TaxID=1622072 RepID=UPI00067F4C71|nr:ROK family glucokinase [Bacillus testis]
MEKWLMGVDLGGTTIKLAFLTANGEILHKWEVPTDISDQGKNITADINTAMEAKLHELGEDKSRILGIGMGAPGPVNAENGVIYEAVNLGWKNYPLKQSLTEKTGLPVWVDNDANTAAIGEMWKGAGAGASDMVCVTLGTGVGGGVIANGMMVQGISGAAGEIGHITAVPENGFECNCGKTGCLETVASATGIVRLALEDLKNHPESKLTDLLGANGSITAKDVVDCARNKDAYALHILDRVSFYLGYALANVANALNPEKIVIGGGVSKAGDILLKGVEAYFRKYTFLRVRESTELAIATLGNDAGVIGAAWMVKTHLLD